MLPVAIFELIELKTIFNCMGDRYIKSMYTKWKEVL